jgi:ferredoxin-NADP reductase
MSTPPKLVDRQEIAEGTMAFRFEKPLGWTFEAGQSIDITLLAPLETDAEGNTRTFTIASAPYEKSLMVATRMRDTAFKRVLKVMPLGTAVQIEGPAGDLTLHRAGYSHDRNRAATSRRIREQGYRACIRCSYWEIETARGRASSWDPESAG